MTHLPPQQFYDDVDIGALWRAVMARKALILFLVLGSGIATFLALQFVTPIYTSQARILIEYEERTFMRPRSDTGNVDRRPLLDQEAVASQVQVLLSRDLAREVVKSLKLAENSEFTATSGPKAFFRKIFMTIGLAQAPSAGALEDQALDAFEEKLSVYQVAKSRVIAVDFDSRDPETAAAAANRLAKAYLTWQQRERLRQTRDASAWLTTQIENLRKQVEEAEEKVENFRSKTGLFAGRNDEALDAQQLSELNSQLILAKAARTEAEARADLINRMLKEKGDVEAAPDVLRSALIQRLLEQRVRVRRELAELSATLLSSHPRIKQLNSELADLSRQIRQEARKVVSGLRNEAQIASAREASLRNSLNELKRQSGQSSEDQIKLRALQREAKANRDLLESYLARHHEASARRDESSVPAHASIISRAHAENDPSFPKKGPMSALMAVAVGLITLVWIVAKELVTATHHRSGIAYAGLPQGRTARPVGETSSGAVNSDHREPEPAHAALPSSSVKTLKEAAGAVSGRFSGEGPHTIIVAGDTCHADTARRTLDISRSLAESGLSVAMVDFTAGGSTIGDLMGLSNIPGVAELVAGTANFEDVISADPASTAQIIPPGALQPDAFSPALGASWARVHHVLGEIYDCVMLHTSLSGARRLVQADPDTPVTVMLVTGNAGGFAFARDIAHHVSSGGGTVAEVIFFEAETKGGKLRAANSPDLENAAAIQSV